MSANLFKTDDLADDASRDGAGVPPGAADQSPAEIERELQERLSGLGLSGLASPTGSVAVPARSTQTIKGGAGGATQALDLRDLRALLRQQIHIAELKTRIKDIIEHWNATVRQTGELRLSELEVRVASEMLPYCREFLPNFPQMLRPVELAMDLRLDAALALEHAHGARGGLTSDEIESCTVRVIQTLLQHPLVPREEAERAELSLQTTTLKDKNGTAVYTPADATYLRHLIDEHNLLTRDGEIGLLAMLISGRKWNKIENETLFAAAAEYTLEALAKKRGVPAITVRNEGREHPAAYILREYLQHHLSKSLEEQIKFIEEFIGTTRRILDREAEAFVEAVRHDYAPRLKAIFLGLLPEAVYRFLHGFEREFLDSSRSLRSKVFLLKRISDFCELSFYCAEALRGLETAAGEVYAAERLAEGAEHFGRRNNLPLAEGMDFFNRKNTLSELLFNAIKYRRTQTPAISLVSGASGGGKSGSHRLIDAALMSDLLNCLNQLRRTFDHDYARGRENNYDHYARWKDLVLEWSRSYARLLSGRTSGDVERYHLDMLAARHIEAELTFVNLHLPSVFRQSQDDFELSHTVRMRQPEDIIKESFLHFWRSYHAGFMTGVQTRTTRSLFAVDPAARSTARLSSDDLSKRAFLARGDLTLGVYTLEVLASYLAPETHDRTVLLQSLEVGLELANRAYIAEEIVAVRDFLRQLQRRLDLLAALSEGERTEYRERLNLTLRDLGNREPLRLGSYLVSLSELETLELTDARALEEWKNVETGIMRMQQISLTLLLTRRMSQIRELAAAFQKWLAAAPISSDSPRRRTFEKRLAEIEALTQANPLARRTLRAFLRMAWEVQSVAAVHDWNPPETYVLEDVLNLETPAGRMRDLETALSLRSAEQLKTLIARLRATFEERMRTTPSMPAYYSAEECEALNRRLDALDRLVSRSEWKVKRTRLACQALRLVISPFQKNQTAEA
jgi:hypothetical protein